MSGVMTAAASSAFATSAARLTDVTAEAVARKDATTSSEQAAKATATESLPTTSSTDTISLSPNAKALLMMNMASDPTSSSSSAANTGIVPILWTNPQSGETEQTDTAGRSRRSNSILV